MRFLLTMKLKNAKKSCYKKHSMLQSVYCVADGLKVRLAEFEGSVIQNIFYNWCTNIHYVVNVFLFTPNGKVASYALNASRAFHGTAVTKWGAIRCKLEMIYEMSGDKFVIHFSFSTDSHPILISSAQD